jgi:asparagine synthetase B (glutamine-hydrolysing)
MTTEIATDLVGLITEAIDARLDGNVGIVLSGGLDSSTVAALAPRHLPTFTGYYDEPDFDEREYARLVAHREHHEIKITPEDFVENFDAMVKHVREPIMGMGTFGQYMVAKFLSGQVISAALSGEGSDELFGGYARQMIVAGLQPPTGYEDYQLPPGYPDNLHDALIYDYERLPELLAVDDQMTGAFGIEARAPFTDERIVAYGLSLPDEERVGKRHLRERVRGIIPDAIIDRTDKKGFPSPLVLWAQSDPIRSFALDRVGYLPDPAKPWDRTWWLDLVRASI